MAKSGNLLGTLKDLLGTEDEEGGGSVRSWGGVGDVAAERGKEIAPLFDGTNANILKCTDHQFSLSARDTASLSRHWRERRALACPRRSEQLSQITLPNDHSTAGGQRQEAGERHRMRLRKIRHIGRMRVAAMRKTIPVMIPAVINSFFILKAVRVLFCR